MALPGSDYLLRLASLSLSFVGFTAIIVTLRRAMGAELSDLHVVVARFFIETGLGITALCVLPVAFSLTGLPVPTTWRAASAAAGLLATVLNVSLIRRARTVKSGPIRSLYFNIAVSTVPLAIFWLNAIGFPFGPAGEPYSLALTLILLIVWWSFIRNLEAFIQPQPPG